MFEILLNFSFQGNCEVNDLKKKKIQINNVRILRVNEIMCVIEIQERKGWGKFPIN